MHAATFALTLLIAAAPAAVSASDPVNAGASRANPVKPFTATAVARFDFPWALAFLPDGRMLVTEKPGRLFLVTAAGAKTAIGGVPKVVYEGQNGLLDVAVAPDFARSRTIYLSFVEPAPGGGTLALATARLGPARLDGLQVIWRASPGGGRGQPGGIIAFDPDGQHLFLTSGDRMLKAPAQDRGSALGKIVRLKRDGTTPAGNPLRASPAAAGTVTGQIWSLGHRNPYGLAFAPDGALWTVEMGPKGGDELNRIEPGKNYGWPVVSYGVNYDGSPIPQHPTRPEYAQPAVFWTPVIAPAGLAFYTGSRFPAWRGSAFIGGLAAEALVRVAFDPQGGAREAERWDMGHRIRDVAVAPDGALWLIEDEADGRLLRLTPKG